MTKNILTLVASIFISLLSANQGGASTASVELAGNLVFDSLYPTGESIGFHDNFSSSIYGRGGPSRTYDIDNLGFVGESIDAQTTINTVSVFNQSWQSSYGRTLTDITTWSKLYFYNDTIYDTILNFTFDGFVRIFSEAFGHESALATASLSIDSKILGNLFDIKYGGSGNDKLDLYEFSEDFSLFLKAGQSDTVTIYTHSYTFAAVPISGSLSYLSLASLLLIIGKFKRWGSGRRIRLI